jgi:hypothetical protein
MFMISGGNKDFVRKKVMKLPDFDGTSYFPKHGSLLYFCTCTQTKISGGIVVTTHTYTNT